jgi:hypothetical protein
MGVTRLNGAVSRGDIADALTDEQNVLVSAPAAEVEAEGLAGSFLPSGADAEGTHVLAVSYTRSPDEWLEGWRSSVGPLPGRCTVVGMGETTRSAAASTGASVGPMADVTVVGENPEDLTGLGITLGERLDRRTVLSFDSLTALLQYVDVELAFRFLHSLTGQVAGAGARAHYLLDPQAHDHRTVATLTELFDATVERTDDGWTVYTR